MLTEIHQQNYYQFMFLIHQNQNQNQKEELILLLGKNLLKQVLKKRSRKAKKGDGLLTSLLSFPQSQQRSKIPLVRQLI